LVCAGEIGKRQHYVQRFKFCIAVEFNLM